MFMFFITFKVDTWLKLTVIPVPDSDMYRMDSLHHTIEMHWLPDKPDALSVPGNTSFSVFAVSDSVCVVWLTSDVSLQK